MEPEYPDQHAARAPTDVQAFRVAYEAQVTPVYRYIYSRVGNREEAEDLTAQVFTKALQRTDWSRDALTVRHWLMQVARTTIADYWRTVYRIHTTSLDDLLENGWEGPVADDSHPPTAERADVVALLDQLPEKQSAVLRYRFLLNCSIKETAQQLGLTEANVKVIQYRALKHAAEIWDDVRNRVLAGAQQDG